METFFIAYAASPDSIGLTIEEAVRESRLRFPKLFSWRESEANGLSIPDTLFKDISNKIFVADITRLNCNVVYEIGYAIGKGKKILLIRNACIVEQNPAILQVGLFDTLGYAEYTNAQDLIRIVRSTSPNIPYHKPISPDITSPVYLVETKYKTDFSARITTRVKKARLQYRCFDPSESPRLSAYEAIEQVGMSYGVILSFLGWEFMENEIHNLRAAFIAGLAMGMDKVRLFLQIGTGTVPLDYKDLVVYCSDLYDIDAPIGDFATDVVQSMQQVYYESSAHPANRLETLNLGASAAENEVNTLKYYYLKTDAYDKVLRGEAQLVIGRKGSGKSAIFLQIRDKEKTKGDNVVLDLKPDSYKLIKFKEQVLDFLEEGTFQHTIMAFWEYVLLLEICHKILEIDNARHLANDRLYNPYLKLKKLYRANHFLTEGDFSERMSILMNSLKKNYRKKYGVNENVRLSLPEITELLYVTDIKELKLHLMEYLKHKEKIWILFDNVDKGWPSSGLKREDFIIIRTLIDASRRIQRTFERNRTELIPVIFLRNDVYDLLVVESSDRQKEAKVLLDWLDADLLRQVILLRIISNLNYDESLGFDEIWRTLCVSHYKGEESFQYIIDRCLMRPRFLINLINHCKSFAINLKHPKIQEEDIEKGLNSYSSDLLTDINFEIRDIFPEAGEILFGFIRSKSEMNLDTLKNIIEKQLGHNRVTESVIDILLWYGFIGVKYDFNEVRYIYSFNYSIQLLKGFIKKEDAQVCFVINPGFWEALHINM